MNEKDYYIEQLNEIGYLLTAEKDFHVVMKKILTVAKKLTNADAGTFYLMSSDEKSLEFTAIQTDSLKINLSKADGTITWPNLVLYKEDGSHNDVNISVNSAINNSLINIPDVYQSAEFDFQGPKAFDESTSYRTTSMLVVPMKSYDDAVIGVLQLINKKDKKNNSIPFSKADEQLILSMSSQAAVSITQSKLVKELETLLDSFVQSIADAIGEKSKYTQGHINRVAEISLLIANAVNEDKDGIYKDKFFTEDQLREIDVAAWMHDIGKITTPEYIVDKATKLETIHDRIEGLQTKFELLKRDKEFELFKKLLKENDKEKQQQLQKTHEDEVSQLDDDFEFIKDMNKGSEFVDDDKLNRLKQISMYQITINNEKQNILNKSEFENLSIRKGTLLERERQIINHHAKISYDMLNALPFPKKLKNVPTIAGGHHEKINGKGYPLGLKGDEISFEAKILAIADIFEALTASDRPYKKANTLKQSLNILSFMVKDQELDKDMVNFFIDKELHLEYAKNNLHPSQLD